MRRHALLLLLFLIPASTLSAAGKPEPLPPGLAKYIMVLWPAGSPIPGGNGTVKTVPEPDVAKLGGRVLAKADNKRVILLPLAAATELRRHEAVVYLQRVWTGESLTNWNESYQAPAGSRFQAAPHSDTNLQWGPKDYSYDGSGNVKQIGSDQYRYDSAERLIEASVGGKTETYTYDSFGNLTQKAVAGGNPVNVNVDGGSNRLIGVGYDAAGNVSSADDGRRTYKYDSMNMLTRVQRPAADERRMIYDADDERIGMINVGDTLSRWTIRDFEGRIIREYKADNLQMWIWEADNFYGDGALMGGETQEWGYLGSYRYGGRRHYHLDHLGSVRMVTDGGSPARSLSEHDYLPFGSTLTRTYQEQINWGDPRIDSMRFAGHWRDFLGVLNVDNTEYLDYMHARYYDPNLGRFASVDPATNVEGALHSPQAWNAYSYVQNNPVLYLDADGRELNVNINMYRPIKNDPVGPFLLRAVHGDDVREAFRGFTTAPMSDRAMATAIAVIAVLDVASNFIEPEKAPAQKAGAVVIGHFPEYLAAGKELGLKTFKVPDAIWEKMSDVARWATNQKFLDRAIARGDEFILAAKEGVRPGSTLAKEIKYIESKGYQRVYDTVKEAWKYVRPAGACVTGTPGCR